MITLQASPPPDISLGTRARFVSSVSPIKATFLISSLQDDVLRRRYSPKGATPVRRLLPHHRSGRCRQPKALSVSSHPSPYTSLLRASASSCPKQQIKIPIFPTPLTPPQFTVFLRGTRVKSGQRPEFRRAARTRQSGQCEGVNE